MKNILLDIINSAIKNASPEVRVREYLKNRDYDNNITVISVGKAACTMAKAVYDTIGDKIRQGFVLTKYGHIIDLPDVFSVYEAGHPIPDENSVRYTSLILDEAQKLGKNDRILFLLSGGASAIFEKPKIPLQELRSLTDSLLRCGADIKEINAVRKAMSLVKGGAFANSVSCPVECIILSDVIGNEISAIGSGPCCTCDTTPENALAVMDRYFPKDSFEKIKDIIKNTVFREVTNATNTVIGSVIELRDGAVKACEEHGYSIHSVSLIEGEARDNAEKIVRQALDLAHTTAEKKAIICYGETTVTVKGVGKGGRNQEMALTAAIELKNTDKQIIFASVGSDGTDGPTDAAGGFADKNTYMKMKNAGINPENELSNNNSFSALKAVNSIIITGATGTNVNDIIIALVN